MTDKHTEFLRKDALERVWCAPDQDNNFTFQLPRVSASSGAFGTVTISTTTITLPDNYNRWQVFQIGGIPPSAFHLLTRLMMWVPAATQANELKTNVRLFNKHGVTAPLADVYYRYTNGGNLLVAVKMSQRVPFDWAQDTYFLNLHSNAYWNTSEGLADPVGFSVGAKYIDRAADLSAFEADYAAAEALATDPSQLTFWKNGLKMNKAGSTIGVGDSVWYELDGAVKKTATFPIRGLANFDSTLDRVRKYVLHPVKDDDSKTIDFFDDIEVFIQGNDALKTSIRLARIRPEHLRNLTHRDYSVSVGAIVYQAALLQELLSITYESLSIHVVVKHSGFNRPLVYEAAFIQELYKLDDFDIQRAITGIDATVPFWRAAELEASRYPAIMQADGVCDVTYPMVEDAYGYYAMARALAPTPSVVINPGNNGFVEVPYLLRWGCTAYEYDEDGMFLGWKQHYSGLQYFVQNDEAVKVELIAGMGSRTLQEFHGVTSAMLEPDRNWRVYLRQRVGGQVQPGFKDVTGSELYRIDELGNFQWLGTSLTDYVTVRSDRRFFAADYTADLTLGRLSVTMNTMQTHDGVSSSNVIVIPLGQMDVMMNGYSLIRGLHYFYEKGQVVITAQQYIDQAPGAQQRIHVRAMGFCQADGKLYPEGDWGFIQHGVLSNNGRFDIRDGRVVRVLVDGKLKGLEDLIFSEDSDQVAPIDPINGQPYLVKDVFIPLKPFAEPDTWSLINKARERSRTVSEYMTLKRPQPPRGPVVAVPVKNVVFSPFLAKILYDLIYGRLGLPAKATFTHQDVMEVCKSYEPLLSTDPLQRGYDPNFVVVAPHAKNVPISVSPRQWQFMNQVVKYYADTEVNLSGTLRISS